MSTSAPGGALDLATHVQDPSQVVDVPDLEGRRLAQAQPRKGGQGDEGAEPLISGSHDGCDVLALGEPHGCLRATQPGQRLGLARVGGDHRSRTAARSTARTLLTLVRIVPGASPRALICLTHCSRWERRSSASGRAADRSDGTYAGFGSTNMALSRHVAATTTHGAGSS